MVEIKGIRFNVSIERKKIKNLYLRISEQTINASAPLNMPEYEIYKFINSKRDWIYNVYNRQQIKQQTTVKYHGGDTFYIFNEKYNLIAKQADRSSCKIIGNNIYLNYSNPDTAIDYLYKYLNKDLLKYAQEYLDKYLYILKDYGYELVPELRARKTKSKWGVCYTRKNLITISSYLIHYPLDCLEYIIVHEVVHFIVPNHSKRFYRIVEQNMPYYWIANQKLKQ